MTKHIFDKLQLIKTLKLKWQSTFILITHNKHIMINLKNVLMIVFNRFTYWYKIRLFLSILFLKHLNAWLWSFYICKCAMESNFNSYDIMCDRHGETVPFLFVYSTYLTNLFNFFYFKNNFLTICIFKIWFQRFFFYQCKMLKTCIVPKLVQINILYIMHISVFDYNNMIWIFGTRDWKIISWI